MNESLCLECCISMECSCPCHDKEKLIPAIETSYHHPKTGEVEELEYYVYLGKDNWSPQPIRENQRAVYISVAKREE